MSWSLLLSLVDGSNEAKEIVVIGGGVAGLAAARRLANEQLTKNIHVTLFEAKSDRYGGRVQTDRLRVKKTKGVAAELGALWLNSRLHTDPIAELLMDWELPSNTTGREKLYLPKQNQVVEDEELQNVYSELLKITKSAVQKVRNSKIDRALDAAILEEISSWDTQTISKNLLKSVFLAPSFPFLFGRSTKHFDPNVLVGWNTVIVDGMDLLVDRLLGGNFMELPIEMELGKDVRQIKMNDKTKKVIVRTTDLKQRSVDAVIVAVPFNVVKSGAVVFEPSLPKRMHKAMDRIESIAASSLILGFNTAFWPENVGVFKLMPEENLESFPIWINMNRVVGRPLLMARTFGKTALFVENEEESVVKNKALQSLRILFGEDTVAAHNITTFIRSQWSADPLSGGGISFPTPDCTEDDVKNLYQPICPYIYFAGEHTMPGLMGTVQGAYQSGIRAAEQLITGFCKEVLAAEQAQKKRNMTTLTNSTTDSLNKADKSTKNENITKKDEL
ncbi:hypothetical protein ScPMuIL_008033 [Solemya velum]